MFEKIEKRIEKLVEKINNGDLSLETMMDLSMDLDFYSDCYKDEFGVRPSICSETYYSLNDDGKKVWEKIDDMPWDEYIKLRQSRAHQ